MTSPTVHASLGHFDVWSDRAGARATWGLGGVIMRAHDAQQLMDAGTLFRGGDELVVFRSRPHGVDRPPVRLIGGPLGRRDVKRVTAYLKTRAAVAAAGDGVGLQWVAVCDAQDLPTRSWEPGIGPTGALYVEEADIQVAAAAMVASEVGAADAARAIYAGVGRTRTAATQTLLHTLRQWDEQPHARGNLERKLIRAAQDILDGR